MLRDFVQQTKTAFLLLVFFTTLTGLIYPLFITLLAQWFFPWQANGSLIEQNGKILGSKLIGQSFDSPRYFWGRPSATTPFPYNGEASAGSNLGPSNPNFLAVVKERIANIRKIQPSNAQPIPVDFVTASASGLDPDISPLTALYQVPRIAKERHLAEAQVRVLVLQHIKKRTYIVSAEPRVNVLELNLALDNLIAAGNGSVKES